MNLLGIETSCDETGLAVYHSEHGLRAHHLFSQVELHALYGGVVPELASRDHVQRILPLAETVLRDAEIDRADIGAIAYTRGPGLAGALMTGAVTAKALAYGLDIPSIGVHHLEAHLLSPMLEADKPPFPFVCLLVSGGHTQLVRVDGVGRYRLLGESVDDAAGEAFDKTAKMLGLPYPGGVALSQLATRGCADAIALPRPMLDRAGLDFSFSGLKTAAITRYKASRPTSRLVADLAASFEAAVADVLVTKSARALEQEGLERLVIAGGVSANRRLRSRADALAAERGWRIWYPRLEFCTDNGAMIALTGALRRAEADRDLAIDVRPRWPLEELSPVSVR